jgi:hypothetical protein
MAQGALRPEDERKGESDAALNGLCLLQVADLRESKEWQSSDSIAPDCSQVADTLPDA